MATNNHKSVEAFKHDEAKRKNIPSAEQQSFVQQDQQEVKQVRYPRNTDLDPQLVWRGKDEQDWSDLVVNAPPIYIQEKVHPKALVDELLRESRESEHEAGQITADLFSDFNGIPKDADKTEFYTHDQNWTNRMILGDSLQVMASLAEREGLKNKVQTIFFDPPYGIKFNSNFQWSTTSRDVKDGKADHITREPEQVKAFRDTWRDGIHSYLTYLRDRLIVSRDLLTNSGSIFVQIGDENVHRVRSVMDEVFGEGNFVSIIKFKTTGGRASELLDKVTNYLLWYCKDPESIKFRKLLQTKDDQELDSFDWVDLFDGGISKADDEVRALGRSYMLTDFTSQGEGNTEDKFIFQNDTYFARSGRHWTTNDIGRKVLVKAGRVQKKGANVFYKKYFNDYPVRVIGDLWLDTAMGGFKKNQEKIYVVQTSTTVVERCILLSSDPGDLVLDPTCGSGTTATVAEQWGRRWITIDTSRVALALARARIMGSRYPFYLLADSRDGQIKEAEITRAAPSNRSVQENIKYGFVYDRVSHITLKSIANNSEIEVIWDKWQVTVDSLLKKLNRSLGHSLHEWSVPRKPDSSWSSEIKEIHEAFWESQTNRQKEVDASIAAKTEFEFLYDKPFENKKKVRVAGPFTVESLSPHRTLGVDENDELIDAVAESQGEHSAKQTFEQMVLQNLESAGVQQAHKADRITFSSLIPWPGSLVCAEGRYFEGNEQTGKERRAAVFIGPEFGTVQRADLVAAAREAAEAGFDALIACAFNYEAHATEFNKLGSIPVLKARMNADLHMAEDLKNTGKGNLFVIFGEPDITLLNESDGRIRVKVNGVDVFKPQTGEVISDGADGIACWFIDTDYNEESFFVRHAYFLGANDPYSALKTTLKAEINADAWATLNSDTSRAFDKPKNGRFAVKVINHLGDEVMKVFKV